MSRDLRAFVTDFVVPLLAGDDVWIGRPLRPRDRDEWGMHMSGTALPDVAFWRLRRAQLLTAHPELPDPDIDELSLWLGLHNLLVFEHPDRPRVWARGITWRRLEGATRTLLTLPHPDDAPTLVARHLAVGAFVDLVRAEVVVATAVGDVRVPAVGPARRFLRGTAESSREHRVPWLPQSHAPETERLLEDALRASPLTCLLRPTLAPAGWSPLLATSLLRDRAWARAVCHAWATPRDWMRTGGAVMSALLPSLPAVRTARSDSPPLPPAPSQPGAQLALPGAVVPCDPRELGALIGSLIHLHLLKVLELDTRVGLALGSREPGVLAFLALPLLLPQLSPVLGEPVPTLAPDATALPVARRWTEYVDHLAELVPRSVVENLLATLVGRIVQPT
jgi:hypothetical protein